MENSRQYSSPECFKKKKVSILSAFEKYVKFESFTISKADILLMVRNFGIFFLNRCQLRFSYHIEIMWGAFKIPQKPLSKIDDSRKIRNKGVVSDHMLNLKRLVIGIGKICKKYIEFFMDVPTKSEIKDNVSVYNFQLYSLALRIYTR